MLEPAESFWHSYLVIIYLNNTLYRIETQQKTLKNVGKKVKILTFVHQNLLSKPRADNSYEVRRSKPQQISEQDREQCMSSRKTDNLE